MIVAVCAAIFFWEGHKGFSMADEGYLWYGAQRVLLGEIPFRDFESYDIGRYYWSAAFMMLAGDNGVVTLRMASMLFQAIALCIGLSLFIRNSKKQNSAFWFLTIITIAVWMIHRHKFFDESLPVILVGTISFLVQQPSIRRYFMTGFVIGVIAVFGRNHGLYGLTGSIGVMIYLMTKRESNLNLIRSFSFWSLGVFAGYLPVLLFMLFVPGFAPAFWESIRPMVLFEINATNIPLPIQWPWLLPFGKISTIEILHGITAGLFFMAIFVFGLLGIIWVIMKRLQKKFISPTLVASVFVAIPYSHYVFSRSDVIHLAGSMPPFLMGIFALLADQPKKIKWPLAGLLFGVSLFLMLPSHPGWYCYSNHQCVNIKAAKDSLKVSPGIGQTVMILNNLVKQYAPGNRTFIAVPFYPGAYALQKRKSPMWEIYPIWPQNESFQQAEIKRIKAANPCLAIVDNSPLDGRDDLRYRNTHSIIDQYIRDNFERLNGLMNDPAIYRSKQSCQ